MKKTLLYIGMALLAVMGFSSCTGDQELPPFAAPTNFTGEGTQDDPYSVSKAVALIKSEDCPTTEVFVKGIVSQIDEVDPSYGNATFYIVDELGSEVNLEIYRCKYLGNTKFTSADQLKVGDEVIVYGKVENFRDKYPEMTQGGFIFELNGKSEGGVPDTPAQGTSAEPKGEGTQASPYNVAKALEVITGANCPTTEVYVEGVIAKIQEVDPSYGNATFYIVDEGFTTQFYIYRAKNLGNTKFTATDQIKVGDKVVMYGKVENFKGNTPEMTQGGYIYSLNGQTSGGSSETPSTPEEPSTPAEGTIFAEAFNNTQGDFTIDNVKMDEALSYIWTATEKYGMKATSYYNKDYAGESWLISPVIDLTKVTDATLTFDHAINFFTDVAAAQKEATVWARVEGGEWQQLSGVVYPEKLSWDFASAGNISLKAFAGKKMQFAFKYVSTSKAGTWEVKNVVVK